MVVVKGEIVGCGEQWKSGGNVVCVDQYITAASIKAELRKENGLGEI